MLSVMHSTSMYLTHTFVRTHKNTFTNMFGKRVKSQCNGCHVNIFNAGIQKPFKRIFIVWDSKLMLRERRWGEILQFYHCALIAFRVFKTTGFTTVSVVFSTMSRNIDFSADNNVKVNISTPYQDVSCELVLISINKYSIREYSIWF